MSIALQCVTVKFGRISNGSKEYLNASLCKFVIYSLQHSETSNASDVFLPLTIAELSTLAHPV